MEPSELVQKVDGELLRHIPLDTLAKANITSLDQVEKKTWRRSQVKSLNTFPLPSPDFIMFLNLTENLASSCYDEKNPLITETFLNALVHY